MKGNAATQVYYAILEYIKSHGYAPTTRELAEMLGYKSPSSIHGYLGVLEDEGFIDRTPGKSRSIIIKTLPPPQGDTTPKFKAPEETEPSKKSLVIAKAIKDQYAMQRKKKSRTKRRKRTLGRD